jgi:hypothetical protein
MVFFSNRYVQVLIHQPDYQTARKYWNELKERLKKEGSESVTKCHQLKMEAVDGKKYRHLGTWMTNVTSVNLLSVEMG